MGILGLSTLLGVPEPPSGTPAAGTLPGEPADPWTELPLPPEVKDGAAHVWTGNELIAWGGCATDVHDDCEATADGYAFDPATQSWDDLHEAPIKAAEALGAWTGREALFVRFRDERRLDGAAYDPNAESWHRIPPAPIHGEYGAVDVWTGSELVVFGGGERHEPSSANGAAYDPRTNRWRSIAEAPLGLNATSGMWTGRRVLVFGSLLDNRNRSATASAVGASYDPDRDRWRELPPSALSPQATSAVWVGGRMVAWDYEVHSQVYDPVRNEWASPLRMPFDFTECYPASTTTRDFALAFYCGHIALYDLERGAWNEIHGGLVDEEIWSKAYDRYLKIWRFAELVPAGEVVYLVAEGLTLNARGVACYGCPGAERSFWAYRSPETLAAESSDPPIGPPFA
jgi:N-acetylneuraminic acid mutarotase